MATTPESTETTVAPKKKRGKTILMAAVMLVVLIAGGGGGAFFFLRMRTAEAAKTEKVKESHDDADSSDKEGHAGKSGSKESVADSNDEGAVKMIVELQPFIVNLADKNESRYLRMSVNLGVGEGAEEKPDLVFTTRVRSAMLAVLTDKTSDVILTAEGKAALRKELLEAARAAVHHPEVHAIYIIDFIVQL